MHFLFSDYPEFFFLLFLFWDTAPMGKKVVMCGDRRKEQGLVLFDIYFFLYD